MPTVEKDSRLKTAAIFTDFMKHYLYYKYGERFKRDITYVAWKNRIPFSHPSQFLN
jgi:hypothetical protein